MIRSFVFGILAACGACSPQKVTDPLVGNYVGWQVLFGEASASDGSHGITEKLALKEDGTFHYQTDSRVMVNIAMQADGTYKHEGNKLTLTGTMKGTFDDGYKKSKQDGPYSLTAAVENGALILKDSPAGEHSFRKEGAGAPPLAEKYKLKPSDRAAVKLLEATAKNYASAKSFTATGNLESKGEGFAPEKAKFKVLFQSPSKFRFEAAKFDGNKEYDRTEITWSGGKTCWWYTKEFGEHSDRALGNALGIAGVSFGSEANLIPSLLLPHQVGGASFAEIYPEITFLPSEVVNGKRCKVIQLRSKGAEVSKMWVDESTGLIVRYFEGIRGETITIDSKMNTAIDPKAFNFGKRSKVAK